MIKIINITKTNSPYSQEGKNWTMYSWFGKVSIDEKTQYAKILTFSKKLADDLINGSEYKLYEVKQSQKLKDQQGNFINEIRINLEKEENKTESGKSGNGRAWNSKEKYTHAEFELVFDNALNYVTQNIDLIGKGEIDKTSIAQSYIKYAFEHGLKIIPKEVINNKVAPELQPDDINKDDDPFFKESQEGHE